MVVGTVRATSAQRICSKLRLLVSNEDFANEMETSFKLVQGKIRQGCKNQDDFSELPLISKRLAWYDEHKVIANSMARQAKAKQAAAAGGKAKAKAKGTGKAKAMPKKK